MKRKKININYYKYRKIQEKGKKERHKKEAAFPVIPAGKSNFISCDCL